MKCRPKPFRSAVTVSLLLVVLSFASARPATAAGVGVKGSGSSFAGIEINQWAQDVAVPPYSLDVNYQSSSSGTGRQDFFAKTVDFAVSDIRYNTLDDSTNIPPADSFMYVPVTAGGVAFMYNLGAHGFDVNGPRIKLTSYTACAIFTGGITQWDDSHIAGDNPGVTLPHVHIHPVVRSDGAGTTFVMEEYCIAEQPSLYAAFAAAASQAGTSTPDAPTSTWPLVFGVIGAQGSDGVAATVANANNDGYITAVEPGYADAHHVPYASVQNDTGSFVQPTPASVGAALSHASQQNDGTHVLNFTPGDAAAYNPSTYSYLILPITGVSAGRGATLTAFANYSLTIGQTEANQLTYASIGKTLEEFGLNRIKAVPGYVPPTADETAAIATTDIGQQGSGGSGSTGGGPAATAATTSAAGSSAAPSAGGAAGGAAGSAGGGGAAGGSVGGGSTAATGGAGGARSSVGGSARARTGTAAGLAGSADPNASLDPSVGAFARTGIESELLALVGLGLLLAGGVGRHLTRRRRVPRA